MRVGEGGDAADAAARGADAGRERRDARARGGKDARRTPRSPRRCVRRGSRRRGRREGGREGGREGPARSRRRERRRRRKTASDPPRERRDASQPPSPSVAARGRWSGGRPSSASRRWSSRDVQVGTSRLGAGRWGTGADAPVGAAADAARGAASLSRDAVVDRETPRVGPPRRRRRGLGWTAARVEEKTSTTRRWRDAGRVEMLKGTRQSRI